MNKLYKQINILYSTRALKAKINNPSIFVKTNCENYFGVISNETKYRLNITKLESVLIKKLMQIIYSFDHMCT